MSPGWGVVPGGCSQKILGVGCSRVHREGLGSQEQLAGSHGDVLQVADDLDLIVFPLQ